MKIVFIGTPEFAVPVLEALNSKYEVVLVVTQPDKLVGRKQTLEYSPVKKCALEHGLKVFQPKKIKDEYQDDIFKAINTIILVIKYYLC